MSHNDAVLIVNNGKIKFCCDSCDECMYVMSKYCKDVYNIDICMGCYYDNKFSHWVLDAKERGRDWFDLRMKHLSDNRKKSDNTDEKWVSKNDLVHPKDDRLSQIIDIKSIEFNLD